MTMQELGEAAGKAGPLAALRQQIESLAAGLRGQSDAARTQRAALLAFAIRVVSAGIAYFGQVFLARWMGSFEYGVFVFVWVWVLILGGLAPLGLSTAVIRLIPEFRATEDWSRLRGLLLGSRLIVTGVSTAVALTGLAGLALFGDAVASYYVLPAYLILFCLPVYTLVDLQDGIARGYSWINIALVPPYVLRPLLILLGMLGAYWAGLPMTAVTAAGAAIVACWISALWQLLILNRRIAESVQDGPREYEIGPWLTISIPILLVHGFELLLQNTDVLVLARYHAPSDVAIYFAALKTMGLISFVHFAVGTAAAHKFSALNAKGDSDALALFIRQAVVWTFWPSLIASVGLLALGWPLLWLFGAEFTAGYPMMFILAVGFLVRAAMGPAEYVLNMLGEQNRCAVVLFCAALLNLGLNFLLIPYWGLAGAATATSVSITAAYVLFLLVARRRLGIDLLEWIAPHSR